MSKQNCINYFLPDLNGNVLSGHVSSNEAKEIMLSCALEKYADARLVVGHGSAIKGKFKQFSDLDILVVCDGGVSWEKKCFVYHGYMIDMQKIASAAISNILINCRQSGLTFAISPLCYGVFLYGDQQMYDDLKELSCRIISTGPDLVPESYISNIKAFLLSSLMELSSSNDITQCKSLSLSIFNNIIVSINVLNKNWVKNGKFSLEGISNSDVTEEEIMKAYCRIMDGEKDDMIILLSKILKKFSPPYWDGLHTVYVP